MTAGAELETGTDAPAAELSTARRVGVLALLLATEFFYGWTWNSVDVLRPYVRDALGLGLVQAGSTYSAQGAGALVGAILFGQLADRFSRRLMLALVVAGYGAALIAGAGVASYPALLVQRFAAGLFMGGYFAVEVGIYVGLVPPAWRGRFAALLNLFFSGSIVALGMAMARIGAGDWHVLLWLGGLPALALAPIALVVLPPASPADRFHARAGHLPIGELFHSSLRRQTLTLAAMAGLNFFAYEAFSGWLTTYLIGERGLSAAVAGQLVAWQFSGTTIAGFVWGWTADRFGRRFNAFGFLIAAAAILVYLAGPTDLALLRAAGILYGSSLCASLVWGTWLAELYPPHLRSTAASIFNWGRIISFFAPLITGALGQHFGLGIAMGSASAALLLAACLWFGQRETLRGRTAP